LGHPAIVLLSGGIDSAACAYFLRTRGHEVNALFFHYGQAAAKPEAHAAKSIASHIGIPLRVHRVSGTPKFPTGELTGRNAFLLSSAVLLAARKPGLLVIGVHAGTTYYDCSPRFLEIMGRLINEQTNGTLQLVVPYLDWSKKEVFDYLLKSGIPVELTYSCEAGTVPPCGRCASCRDRKALGC
jgi:7-cyano-7-deazaguanine synthase